MPLDPPLMERFAFITPRGASASRGHDGADRGSSSEHLALDAV